jgi:hypothetical protein
MKNKRQAARKQRLEVLLRNDDLAKRSDQEIVDEVRRLLLELKRRGVTMTL